MSAASVYNGQQNAPLTTCVVPMPDEHLLQPHPFATEDEYWALTLARLETRHWWQHLQAQRATLLTTGPGLETAATLSTLHEHQTALAAQYAHLLQVYRTRVACTPPQYPAPRMLRVAARLNLTEAERDVLHYLILTGCEGAFSAVTMDECDVGDIADFLRLDPHMFFALLDPTRPLLRYDLIQIDRHPVEAPRRRTVSMELVLIKTLRGAPLTEEDLSTLDTSVIRDVLLEEPALALSEKQSEAPDAPQEPVAEPCCLSDMPQGEPAVVSPGSGAGFVASQSLMPMEEQTPYTSDLDYLQEHLAWFKARYKWKSLLEEHDDATSYDRHADDLPRRLREAQTQERACRHRIERRLRHTHAAGTWLPRAE